MTAEELTRLRCDPAGMPQVRRKIEQTLTQRNAYDVNVTPTKP